MKYLVLILIMLSSTLMAEEIYFCSDVPITVPTASRKNKDAIKQLPLIQKNLVWNCSMMAI